MSENRVFTFDSFRADIQTGELHYHGQKIPVQQKLFQLLVALLERSGEVVSREELRQTIWPSGTHVDFDRNIKVIVARLRQALGDSAESPKFIETVGSRGYRFIVSAVPGINDSDLSTGGKRSREDGTTRIAVLPFHNLSPQSKSAWLADGVTEQVIALLGHLFSRQLGVIARTSTLQYKETTKDITRIGRELKVAYIVEGSLRCVSDRISITAQLIRVADQTHLWAETHDFRSDDPIGVQNEVAALIARSVGHELRAVPGEANVTRRNTINQQAYRSYLKGCYHQSKRTEQDLEKSVLWFERAVQEDCSYAAAYANLARSLWLLGSMGFGGGPPKDFYPRSKEAALKALQLDDTLAECHAALAYIEYVYDWDWPAAERLFCRAIELNPSDPFAHIGYSYFLSSDRRDDEAVSQARQACELDPLSFSANYSLAIAHYFARQYDQAIPLLENILELEPKFGYALMWLGATYSQSLQHEKAISTLQTAEQSYPSNGTILAWLGGVYAKAGMVDKARELIGKLHELSEWHYVSNFDFALVHASLKQYDEAFQWLEKAYEERSPFLAKLLLRDARFDDLRRDPRYDPLVDRIVVTRA